tara:strand:+ start:532 stop:1059 length:528 start_codon:yes stop_codon:yes gene_type:complete
MNNTKKYKKHLKTTLKLFGGKKNKIANRFARKTFKKFIHNVGGAPPVYPEYPHSAYAPIGHEPTHIFPPSPHTLHPLGETNDYFRRAAADEEASRLLGVEEERVKIAREIDNRRKQLNTMNAEDVRKIRVQIMNDARQFLPDNVIKSWKIPSGKKKEEMINDIIRLEYEISPRMK